MARYHKALALAMAGDFGAARGDPRQRCQRPAASQPQRADRPCRILAQIGRGGRRRQLLDDAVANGFPDATLVALRTG